MNIAILHLGNITQIIPASSVLNGIKKRKADVDITWIVRDEFKYFFKHNKDIRKVINIQEFIETKEVYDLLINLYPFFPKDLHTNSTIKNFTGFCFCEEYDEFKDIFLGKKKFLNINIFQLYYILAGLVWKGEGYDIKYYPKTRAKVNRIGVSVANANLRNYILDNLEVENMKIWYIPYKKNVFKKMDEINRCKKVITDDMTTLHLSVALRKYVYYLETLPLTTNIELFNNGEIYKVPTTVFQ